MNAPAAPSADILYAGYIAGAQRSDQPVIPPDIDALKTAQGQAALARNELASMTATLDGITALIVPEMVESEARDVRFSLLQLVARGKFTLLLMENG